MFTTSENIYTFMYIGTRHILFNLLFEMGSIGWVILLLDYSSKIQKSNFVDNLAEMPEKYLNMERILVQK